MQSLDEISEILSIMTKAEINTFLNEMLTSAEINTLSKRWRILKLLSAGITQREIAKELGVSLCKVTRGAKILKSNAISKKFITGVKNDNEYSDKI